MKIALVRQRYNPFGGAERFVARAIDALENEGMQLTIVTRQWQTAEDAPSIICNPFHIGSLWRDWGFARCVCHELRHRHFDLVQSHERLSCCDVYRAGDGVHRSWLKQRSRILSLAKRIGIVLNPYHQYVLAAEKRLFSSSRLKAVVCNSAMVKNEIIEYFGVAEEKLHVIYSGVDTTVFHPDLKTVHRARMRKEYGISEKAALFLFVGSGFERKGLGAAMQAIASVPKAHLMVVGTDKKAGAYQQTAEMSGLAGRIHFVGGQRDVTPYYGAGDAFILPTLYDPFPNAALEAMAAGLAVITSTTSGAAELIQHGKNGFVCDALDISALTDSIDKLASPETASQMGAAARATVLPYTFENMGRQLQQLYRSILPKSA